MSMPFQNPKSVSPNDSLDVIFVYKADWSKKLYKVAISLASKNA